MAKKEKSEGNAKRNQPTQRDIFTREEKRKFLRSVENLDELIFVRLGFYGGLRISEIAKFMTEDIIFNDRMPPLLHIKEAKGGKSRYANIDEATAQIIIASREGLIFPSPNDPNKPITTRTLENWFDKILERSGITRIDPTPHTLRHTNITMLIEKGMHIEKVKEHAGHSDISTTMIYLHLTYHDRARVFDEIIGE